MVAPGILQVVAGCLGPLLISPRLLRPSLSFWGGEKVSSQDASPLSRDGAIIMEGRSRKNLGKFSRCAGQGAGAQVLVPVSRAKRARTQPLAALPSIYRDW